jgi:hypothetical protein
MQYLWWVLVVWKLVEIALYPCLLMLLSATYTGHILKFNINVATDKSYNGPHQIYEHIRSDWLRWLWQEFNSVATISQQIYSPSLGTVVFTFEAINNARRNLLWQYFFVRNKFITNLKPVCKNLHLRLLPEKKWVSQLLERNFGNESHDQFWDIHENVTQFRRAVPYPQHTVNAYKLWQITVWQQLMIYSNAL